MPEQEETKGCPTSPMRPKNMPSLRTRIEGAGPAPHTNSLKAHAESVSRVAQTQAQGARPELDADLVSSQGLGEELLFPQSPATGSIWGTAQWAEAMRGVLGAQEDPLEGLQLSAHRQPPGPQPEEHATEAPPVPTNRAPSRGPLLPPAPVSPKDRGARPEGSSKAFLRPTSLARLAGRATHSSSATAAEDHTPIKEVLPSRPLSAPAAPFSHEVLYVGLRPALPRASTLPLHFRQEEAEHAGSTARHSDVSAVHSAASDAVWHLGMMWWGAHPAETCIEADTPAEEVVPVELPIPGARSDYHSSEVSSKASKRTPKGMPPLPDKPSSSAAGSLEEEEETPLFRTTDNPFGGMWPTPPPLEAPGGAIAGHFGTFSLGARLLAAQGGGGWGPKFIAVDVRLHRRVVLWRFTPPKELEAASRHKLRDAVASEVDRLKSIRHSRLCPYLACENLSGDLHVISGYAPGGSVADWLADTGPLTDAPAKRVMRATLEGLSYLHHEGLVHGALRGGNVLLGPGSAVRLCDFGISCTRVVSRASLNRGLVGGEDPSGNGLTGSTSHGIAWLAPELLEGGLPSPAGDMWACGCLAVEVSTGHPPAPGTASRALRVPITTSVYFRGGEVPLLPNELKQLLPSLVTIVKRCLEPAPATRPSAQELLLSVRRDLQ